MRLNVLVFLDVNICVVYFTTISLKTNSSFDGVVTDEMDGIWKEAAMTSFR